MMAMMMPWMMHREGYAMESSTWTEVSHCSTTSTGNCIMYHTSAPCQFLVPTLRTQRHSKFYKFADGAVLSFTCRAFHNLTRNT
eukprot:m.189028 g.189028  ORF g.189028 m.189028 type:complete len:84 (+) comp18528_c0_seq58:36-287(+)